MPRPEHVYRTEGIILRRHDLGEADRILTLFTRDYGKLKVVAKGVRKPISRKAGHVELFMRVETIISRGRTLDVLTQVDVVEAYLQLRQDLIRATYAAHFGELIDAFIEEGDENRAAYQLLSQGLGWLCATGDLRRTARYFELQALKLVGFRPELFQCAVCGAAIQPQKQFYSVVAGGVVCPTSEDQAPRTRPISLNALKVMRYMQRESFEHIEQLQLSSPVQREVERLLHETLTYHIERRLKSAAFLKRLRQEAARSERQQHQRKAKGRP